MAESREWAPGHWTEKRIRLFLFHVDRHCEECIAYILGWGMAHVLMAQIRSEYAAALSVRLLNDAGVKTLGQV